MIIFDKTFIVKLISISYVSLMHFHISLRARVWICLYILGFERWLKQKQKAPNKRINNKQTNKQNKEQTKKHDNKNSSNFTVHWCQLSEGGVFLWIYDPYLSGVHEISLLYHAISLLYHYQ